MGRIFFPDWDDKKPKPLGIDWAKELRAFLPKVETKREYWGFSHFLITYSDGSKELICLKESIRKLFYKANGWDEDGQPIFTDESR